jgi:hypothetical protein
MVAVAMRQWSGQCVDVSGRVGFRRINEKKKAKAGHRDRPTHTHTHKGDAAGDATKRPGI